MKKIAIVEDEDIYIEKLQEYLKQYEHEFGERFDITVYRDGDSIVDQYKAQFDLILMDIQMKFVDGMTAAEEIRQLDPKVGIIFITNMTQYAIRGYEVDALAYILKPVNYFQFSQKLKKALGKIKNKASYYITVSVKGGVHKIALESLLYVESQGHTLNYHLNDNVISNRENISNIEQMLEKYGFFRINKGCLVNLKYVDTVINGNCVIGEENLPVSRPRRKLLLEKLTEYISEVR